MTERPIIFSGQMVRAILDGTKTQTRRVMHRRVVVKSPYGEPSDRLWVRETHAPRADCWGSWHRSMEIGRNRMGPRDICYQATPEHRDWVEKWRPSIHMPRWACRLVLEVTGVRVERLQEISEDDAKAEGIEETTPTHGAMRVVNFGPHLAASARSAYKLLWDSLNAKRGFGWSTNPWVWAIEFRRASPHDIGRQG